MLFLRLGATSFGGPAAFLDGVNAASLALMAVVSFALLRAAVTDVVGGGVFVVTVMLLWRTRVNPTWLIAGGAVLGGARQLLSTVVAP